MQKKRGILLDSFLDNNDLRFC